MTEDLYRINNTLLMYAYSVDDNGLFYGKTGLMLCLMISGKYLNCQSYFDMGGKLLDGLITNSVNAPTSFENGLAGLGWSICFLMKNDVLEGDGNIILHNIDERLMKELYHSGWSRTLGELIYFTERIKIKDGANAEYCKLINQYILWRLKNKSNSMTEFEYKALASYVKQSKTMFPMWEEALSEIEQMIQHINIRDDRFEASRYFDKKEESYNLVLNYIKEYMNSMFFNAQNDDSIVYNVKGETFITICQDDISDDNLSLISGLAGLGISFIKESFLM